MLSHMRTRHLPLVLLLLAQLASPIPTAAADDTFGPLAGTWEHHGFSLTLQDDGTGEAVWRVYRFCDPGEPTPCDQIVDNGIISGGHAQIALTGSDDSGVFQGTVTATTDPALLDEGPITLTPEPYDMALLEQGDTQIVLCGEHVAEVAPPAALQSCGA